MNRWDSGPENFNLGEITIRKKILLVGMADSIHFARWVESIDLDLYEVRVMGSSPHRSIHPIILKILSRFGERHITMSWLSRYFSLFVWILDRTIFPMDSIRSWLLRFEIKKFNPDLVHAMETQNAGYLLPKAIAGLRSYPIPYILLTLYGSDLFWYSQKKRHVELLRKTLSKTDFLSAECLRGHAIARELGFLGEFLPLSPANPPIPIPELIKPPASRRLILVKGYKNKWGRGDVLIRGLSRCTEILKNYEIVIISAEGNTPRLARTLLARKGLSVRVFRKKELDHETVLRELSESILYVGLSASDGLPSTLVEAVSLGAFPIQSASSCASDWLSPKENIILIENHNSPEQVEIAVREALTNYDFLTEAQNRNINRAKGFFASHADYNLSTSQYDFVFSQTSKL